MRIAKYVSECIVCGKDGCHSPCYDYCGCSNCWKGWVELTKWERIKNRIRHIWFKVIPYRVAKIILKLGL